MYPTLDQQNCIMDRIDCIFWRLRGMMIQYHHPFTVSHHYIFMGWRRSEFNEKQFHIERKCCYVKLSRAGLDEELLLKGRILYVSVIVKNIDSIYLSKDVLQMNFQDHESIILGMNKSFWSIPINILMNIFLSVHVKTL